MNKQYMSCEVVYVYCLFLNKKPIYIGQSYNSHKRYKKHKSSFHRNVDKYIYNILHKNFDDDIFNEITMKTLLCCSSNNADEEEMRLIKMCLDKNINTYNNCVKTNSYRTKKQLLQHLERIQKP
jgi:predicted GIY-YIG superfamily endonuclease